MGLGTIVLIVLVMRGWPLAALLALGGCSSLPTPVPDLSLRTLDRLAASGADTNIFERRGVDLRAREWFARWWEYWL